MEADNAFQIAGLYFQYVERLETQFGDAKIHKGIEVTPFQGMIFRRSLDMPFTGQMLDGLGMSELSDFWLKPDGTWGYTKAYVGENRRHSNPIIYKFDERSEDGSYWIGRYDMKGDDIWGEAHAVLTPIPNSFMHLSKLPQIYDYGDNGVLPRLEDQDEDIRAMCEKLVSHEHSLTEVWVEVYCMCERTLNRKSCSLQELFQEARGYVVSRGDSLLNALRRIESESLVDMYASQE